MVLVAVAVSPVLRYPAGFYILMALFFPAPTLRYHAVLNGLVFLPGIALSGCLHNRSVHNFTFVDDHLLLVQFLFETFKKVLDDIAFFQAFPEMPDRAAVRYLAVGMQSEKAQLRRFALKRLPVVARFCYCLQVGEGRVCVSWMAGLLDSSIA